MKFLVFALVAVFSLSSGAKEAAPTKWGKAFKYNKKNLQSVSSIFKDLNASKKDEIKNVVLKGEIESVCKKKGCWLTLKGSEKSDACVAATKGDSAQTDLRVVFEDYGFFVPKELQGNVVLKGTVKKEKLSKFQVKHFLKDLKCSKKQIKAVKGPIYRYRMTASGLVKI